MRRIEAFVLGSYRVWVWRGGGECFSFGLERLMGQDFFQF